MNTEKNTNNDSPFAGSPLDDLLQDWHNQNAEATSGSRDALAARLAAESTQNAPIASIGVTNTEKDALVSHPAVRARSPKRWALPLAAMIAIVGAVAVWFAPTLGNRTDEFAAIAPHQLETFSDESTSDSPASSVSALSVRPEEQRRSVSARKSIPARVLNAAYTPVAGRLDAIDPAGNKLGACPLEHTEVDVDIVGRFARVSLTQHYYNTFSEKIEAVYTFPMSQDGAVDGMRITVGDRVIEAEIQERDRARQIYEAARARGNTAALLEQERPNIFAQSVANIEPGEQVTVHISYIEMVSESDGVRSFDFPMVVAPRYIPGGTPPRLGVDSPAAARPGEPFAEPTDDVPDADRITPTPTHPDTRAGHDISINVSIDTGGPALLGIQSNTHTLNIDNDAHARGAQRMQAELSLASLSEIPNKDFVVTWRQEAGFIEPLVFTHTGELGSFATLVLEPPARVTDAVATPKELVFVLDTSGSMNGQPIDKAKQVIDESLAALRPRDTFNIITFAGSTRVLWDEPRPGTPEHIQEARAFVSTMRGAGGTEMMHAINKALIQSEAPFKNTLAPEELAQLPADGRNVIVRVAFGAPREVDPVTGHVSLHMLNNRSIETSPWIWQQNPSIHCPVGVPIFLTGRWATEDARRILKIEAARYMEPARPLRIVAFLTDGQVGNDQAIIAAVERNAASTRVFSFGVGPSPNRYLLDSMARASKGEVEYVDFSSDATEQANRFAARISTPVLRDVTLTLPASLAGAVLSSPDLFNPPRLLSTAADGGQVYELPDLFDVKPITIHARLDRPASGEIIFGGRSPLGEFKRPVPVSIESGSFESQLPTLWARAEVSHVMNEDLLGAQQGVFPAALRERVVELGLEYSIMSRFTSFVAVDRARVTLGGEPRLVRVPIELPEGMNYWKIFSRLPEGTRQWLAPNMASASPSNPLAARFASGVDGVQELKRDMDRAHMPLGRSATNQSSSAAASSPMPLSLGRQEAFSAQPDWISVDASGFGDHAADTFADSKKSMNNEAHPMRSMMLREAAESDIGLRERTEDESTDAELSAEVHGRLRLLLTKLDADILALLAKDEPGRSIRVVILLTTIDERSLSALVAAGATIESKSAASSIVIATLLPASIDTLASLDAVLRIELASVSPASGSAPRR
jgi:hypothetical protein